MGTGLGGREEGNDEEKEDGMMKERTSEQIKNRLMELVGVCVCVGGTQDKERPKEEENEAKQLLGE